MKYLTIIFLIFIFACERCNEMTIDHDLQKTYTETFTRTVGATERTGVRGTFPQPAPTDLNTISLAITEPDGITPSSDANAGTVAKPKASLNGAIAALGGAITTVQIIRNNYSGGNLEFSETVASTLGVGYDIQCEEGEIGYITFTSAAGSSFKLTLSGTNKLNGLYITDEYLSSNISAHVTVYCISTTLTYTFTNCTFTEDWGFISGSVSPTSGWCLGAAANSGGITIEYCDIINYRGLFGTNATKYTINNTMFINNSVASLDDDFIIAAGGITIYSSTTASQNLVIDRCLFSGFVGGKHGFETNDPRWKYFPTAINFMGSSFGTTPAQQTVTIDSTHLYNSDGFVLINEGLYPGSTKTSITFNNDVYPMSVPVTTNATSMPANNTWTINNRVEIAAVLFHNELDFVNNFTIESARLQREGQITPDGSGKYYLTSPLVGAGVSGDDITPFDESVVYVSMAFNKTLDINWPPQLFNFGILHQHPVNLRNVKGNLQRTFDTKRRSFGFQWGDGEHISNIQVKQLGLMIADNGSKKFFPMGRNVNIFEEDISSTGIFSDTDNSLNPTMAASVPMVDDWWAGLWVNIAGDEFYIESNDETKLYLLDKLDLGFPSNGLQTFIIDSILVNTEAIKYLIKQANFTSFRDGGFLREDYDNEVRPFDYTIETITLEEIEDIEENV